MKPTNQSTGNYNYDLAKYELGIKRSSSQVFEDQDNNLQAYKIMILHCSPKMMSKLEMMAGWIKVQE